MITETIVVRGLAGLLRQFQPGLLIITDPKVQLGAGHGVHQTVNPFKPRTSQTNELKIATDGHQRVF